MYYRLHGPVMTVFKKWVEKSERVDSNGADLRPDRSSPWANCSGSNPARARLDVKRSALDTMAGGANILSLAVSVSCLISLGPVHSHLRLAFLLPTVCGSTVI
jgi:hypothetical protein